MADDRQVNDTPAKLPRALVERLTRPFSRFLQIETAAGAVLLAATVVALLLSNSRWADAFLAIWETPVGVHIGSGEAVRSLKEWINDGVMTLFFFLVALELKREIVLGELGQPRVAALSIAAAAGGMLVPAAIYLMLQSGQSGAEGWGTVMATDTAFVIGCLALLGCAQAPHSTMRLEKYGGLLPTTGPDAVALPVADRYRYGVVLGAVMTASGARGCDGEVWLQPLGAPVRDVRSIAPARFQNMFRFPQLLPGRYELGVRCFGFRQVRRKVQVRIGHVLRAVVTMSPLPPRTTVSAR